MVAAEMADGADVDTVADDQVHGGVAAGAEVDESVGGVRLGGFAPAVARASAKISFWRASMAERSRAC